MAHITVTLRTHTAWWLPAAKALMTLAALCGVQWSDEAIRAVFRRAICVRAEA